MPIPGLKPKDLVMVPARSAIALQADGWWVRQDIIWSKPNPMPESVLDRCTKSHEYLFLLSKSERYYFDAEAIAEPVSQGTVLRMSQLGLDEQYGSDRVPGKTNGPMKPVLKRSGNKARKPASARGVPDGQGKNQCGSVPWEGATRNKRSVWTVTTRPFKEAHFATFPPALIEPCILAGCPEGGTVLDPFGGAGTTGLVADRHKRNAILIELNPEYAEMARRRIKNDSPLFAEVS
jgi:DNA modification methylase